MDDDDDDLPGMPHFSAFLRAYGLHGRGFRLEINNYSVWINSQTQAIQFSCAPERDLRKRLSITKDEKDIDDLPIVLILRRVRSSSEDANRKDVIGHLVYSDAVDADENLSAQPAMAEGEVVASASAFDTILMLLLKQRGQALLGLRVKGTRSGWPFGPIWDISKTSKLEIVYFDFNLLDRPADDADSGSADPAAVIERIEERLARIEGLIQHGVRIRLFD